jgi:hypothetical protein
VPTIDELENVALTPVRTEHSLDGSMNRAVSLRVDVPPKQAGG